MRSPARPGPAAARPWWSRPRRLRPMTLRPFQRLVLSWTMVYHGRAFDRTRNGERSSPSLRRRLRRRTLLVFWVHGRGRLPRTVERPRLRG
jgi:hypothetical protein